MGISQAFCSFFTCNALKTQEETPTYLWVSLYVVFSLFSSLSCELSSLPCSSCTVSSDPSTQGVHRILLGFSIPVLRPRNSLKAVSWVKYRINLPCILFLRGHCLLLPDVHCLRNYCFIYFVYTYFVVVSGGKINPILVTPSCLPVEVNREAGSGELSKKMCSYFQVLIVWDF